MTEEKAVGGISVWKGKDYVEPMPLQLPPMTLRDYLAGQALAGLLASDAGIREGNGLVLAWCDERCLHGAAERSYMLADAMLSERERRK